MDTIFRPYQTTEVASVTQLMLNLSAEDFSGWMATEESILLTLDHFMNHPEKGSILVFENKKSLIGYSIIINYWSNEFKGNVLLIDELYILPAYRSKGIATAFFHYLSETRFNDSVMLQLEVSVENSKAIKLYERIGFKLNSYQTFKKKLT